MARYLVQGDPLVALGPATLIPDGALIVEGPQITDVGPRDVLAARGPFDRVLGSADHFVMPGFINCHARRLSQGGSDLAGDHGGTDGGGRGAD